MYVETINRLLSLKEEARVGYLGGKFETLGRLLERWNEREGKIVRKSCANAMLDRRESPYWIRSF